MGTLFDITAEILAILEKMEQMEADGSTPEEVEAAIRPLFRVEKHELEQKVDNYAALIRELETRSQVRAQESKRIAEIAKADSNRAARCKSWLLYNLSAIGCKKVNTERFNVTVAKNGGKAPLLTPDDVTQLPPEYRKVEESADNQKIREAIDAGLAVKGCKLGERGISLRIK